MTPLDEICAGFEELNPCKPDIFEQSFEAVEQ